MSTPENERPRPQYGEYAPTPPAPPTYEPVPPVSATPVPAADAPPARRADRVISIALLMLSVFITYITVNMAVSLSTFMTQYYATFGLEFGGNDALPIAQAVIIVSHLVLFVVSVLVTINRLSKHKLSFWVPLSAGVIAGLFWWGTMFALVFSDPVLIDAIQRQAGLS